MSLMRSRGGDLRPESITYKHSLWFASGLKPKKYFFCLRTTVSAVNCLANENDSFWTLYRFVRTIYTSVVARVLSVDVDVIGG